MKNKSYIFEDSELEIMNKRINGDYSDKTGIFSRRTRPKLRELLIWSSPKMRSRIKKLLEQKRKTNTLDEPATPTEEQSFEEFRQTIGY